MNELSSKQIIIKGFSINYFPSTAENSNYNVIFIHGWLSNSKVWLHLMHALKKIGISSFALDLPGFGSSQIPKQSVDNSFYSDVVKEFVAKLNLQNVVLVGHSNGGAIAVKSIVSGLNVSKLILIDAAGIRSKSVSKVIKTMGAKIVKPIFKIKFLQPIRRRIYYAIGSEDYLNSEYLSDTYKNVITEDISNLYKQIKTPTLIIWGKDDKDTPLSFGEFINENIESSELKIVEGGHFSFIDKPDQVINYLINFLK